LSGPDRPGGPSLNPAAIVAALNRNQVRYVIIGAFAAIAQQAPIPATRDIDFTPETSQENLARLSRALTDGEFDISFRPSGFAGGYAELALNAHRLRIGEVEVVVADLADVIRSKESAGRTKDLRVLPLLYRHLAGRRAEREAEQE